MGIQSRKFKSSENKTKYEHFIVRVTTRDGEELMHMRLVERYNGRRSQAQERKAYNRAQSRLHRMNISTDMVYKVVCWGHKASCDIFCKANNILVMPCVDE